MSDTPREKRKADPSPEAAEESPVKKVRVSAIHPIGHGCSVKFVDLRPYRDSIDRAIADCAPLLECKPPCRLGRMRREVGFFPVGDVSGYKYAGTESKALETPESLSRLVVQLNELFGTTNNGALVNKYPGKGEKWSDGTVCDGEATVGEHSDSEEGLVLEDDGPHGGVIAINWGAERKFRVRDKATGRIYDFPKKAYYALIMHGRDFQKKFVHGVPVQKKIYGTNVSITLRKHQGTSDA